MTPADPRSLLNLAAAVLLSGATLGAVGLGLREVTMLLRRTARLRGEQVGSIKATSLAAQAAAGMARSAGRVGAKLAAQDPTQQSILRLRLIQSGFAGRDVVAIYLGIRLACLVTATVGTFIALPWLMATGGKGMALMIIAGTALALVMAPDQVLRTCRRRLEIEYREGFPDVLDLLVASVQAGLSLDAAVSRVAEELSQRRPKLAEHLRFLTLELRAGKARKDAWANLADRLGLDEARSFATILRQSETMGTSVGDTLTVFSADMRIKRMLRAEEKAMALSAKLTVPLILFIFPCLLTILLLPSMFRAAKQFHGM